MAENKTNRDRVTEMLDAYAALHVRPLTQQKETELCLRDTRNAIIARLDQRDELLAALKAMRAVMDRGDKPKKLDAALSWRECDEKARAMCDAAIARAESSHG